jgi:phosphatidylserine/phosphatidylglycerophosphate/cardiolipin synthase-like enzyme
MSRRRRRTGPASGISGIVAFLIVLGVVLWLMRDRLPSINSLPVPKPPAAEKPAQQPSPSAANLPYEVFFTTPVYPDKPETRHGGIDERFVQYVDAATKTLDVAAYEFDLENVAQAIVRAKSRGVAVRMVTDSDTVNAVKDAETQKALKLVRDAGITIVPDERSAIMHHKFAVRDGEEIWTGSWNLTTGDTYRLNNNAVHLRSPELARVFTQEFEKMFVQKKFGGSKPKGAVAEPVQVGDLKVQVLFAPEDGVAQKVAERISQASSQIRFLAFSFTHDGIGQAVLGRAKAGVPVAGVFEKTGSETRFSEYGAMKQAGLDVYQDGNPYVMHHKVFVVDGKTTVFGSFNFSDGADKDNDENCLIVEDPAFAAKYLEETERMLALARNPSSAKATPEKELPR